MNGEATLPALLRGHARRTPEKPSMREKRHGIWQTYTWSDAFAATRDIALGFASLGFESGDRVALLGDNRPNLYWTLIATQTLGGVAILLNPHTSAKHLAKALCDANVGWVVVEGEEQLSRLLEVQSEIPALRHVLVDNTSGLHGVGPASWTTVADVKASGRVFREREPTLIDRIIDDLSANQIALMSYTAGATSPPKGVLLSHRALIAAATAFAAVEDVRFSDDWLSYLPMAWIADSLFSVALALTNGIVCNCPEGPETVFTNLIEIGPHGFFAPWQVWEELKRSVESRAASSSRMNRLIFDYFHGVALAAQDEKSISLTTKVRLWLGELLIYRPVRDKLGFGRCRSAYVGGLAIDPATIRYLRAFGIDVKQLYGTTETAGLITLQKDFDRGNDLGLPVPGAQIRLGFGDEIEIKSPSAFSAYLNDSETARHAVTPDQWIGTGDVGALDEQGRLILLHRRQDIAELSDGTRIQVRAIETALKQSPFIRQVLFVADRRPYPIAIVIPNASAVAKWANEHGLACSSIDDLKDGAELRGLICGEIDKCNQALLESSRVRKFVIASEAPEELDTETTRFRETRRWALFERYHTLIEEVYSGRPSREQDVPGCRKQV